MNSHHRMRAKLWGKYGVAGGLVTPQEARTIELLWTAEERDHRLRDVGYAWWLR